jgi:hypothetical protein
MLLRPINETTLAYHLVHNLDIGQESHAFSSRVLTTKSANFRETGAQQGALPTGGCRSAGIGDGESPMRENRDS